jgi:enoyl-CoA hydratase
MSEHQTPPVLVERRGRLGVLTLNRPRAINALNHEMVRLLQRTLDAWADDPDIATVVLTGAGERGLCAGGDIVTIYRDADTGGRGSEDFWRDEYRLNATIASYPKPYVAVMDGLVLGGGVGVSAHAAHRVVTERTRIGMPETGIGFVPDVGGTWLLSQAPGELGTYLALTAGHVDAGDAIELGLADHFVPSSKLGRLVDLLIDLPVDQALAEVAGADLWSRFAESRAWIDETFRHHEVADILDALTAHRDPAATAARDAMIANSPTSLVVTLRALRSTREFRTLEEALAQEYRVALRMLRGHDFPEGIRARVIEKDRNPQWDPPSVAAVEPAAVEAHFAPLGDAELRFDRHPSLRPARSI